MAGKHPDLPTPLAFSLSKARLLDALSQIDRDTGARNRVLAMESNFRQRIGTHIQALPLADASFKKFFTNPFVLLFQCARKQYTHIHQIEDDILPAKLFSSMETSAGRMVETVVLPVYSWECVASAMHSTDSVLDGKRVLPGELRLATLKSGPRCLNDGMTKDIADGILCNAVQWAQDAGVNRIDFTYGVLYGTKKQSNKKDWHILRKICENLSPRRITTHARKRWNCAFEIAGVSVDVTVRIGCELWRHISEDENAFLEICVALIRACVAPCDTDPENYEYVIADLREIISLEVVPANYNVSILQRSQLEWLFFVARHFCDALAD